MAGGTSIGEGLEALARDNQRTVPLRLVIIAGGAALFGANLGWRAGVLTYIAMMAVEAFTQWVSRPNAVADRRHHTFLRLAGTVATSVVWTLNAVIYWRDGGFAGQVVALVQLCSLLIIAQNLSFKSLASSLCFGVLPLWRW
jgi:hypothetical protein